MKIFRAFSVLLTYPTAEILAAIDDIGGIFEAEPLLDAENREALRALTRDIAAQDLYALQERYVLLFDRTRALSLHMFEHIHGESRDRGQAMVDLRALYESKGLTGVDNELPDFIPLFLEFLSTLDPVEALALLGDPAHVFVALAERLQKRGSAYEALFRALIALASAAPDEKLLAQLRAEPDPAPDDLAALDEAYEEAPVDFSAPAEGACDPEALIAKLRQARRPAPGVAHNAAPATSFTFSAHSHAPEADRHG